MMRFSYSCNTWKGNFHWVEPSATELECEAGTGVSCSFTPCTRTHKGFRPFSLALNRVKAFHATVMIKRIPERSGEFGRDPIAYLGSFMTGWAVRRESIARLKPRRRWQQGSHLVKVGALAGNVRGRRSCSRYRRIPNAIRQRRMPVASLIFEGTWDHIALPVLALVTHLNPADLDLLSPITHARERCWLGLTADYPGESDHDESFLHDLRFVRLSWETLSHGILIGNRGRHSCKRQTAD